MQVLEVPTPVLRVGMVLVRNHYSLISPGTEGSTVKAARGTSDSRFHLSLSRRQLDKPYRQEGLDRPKKTSCLKLLGYSP